MLPGLELSVPWLVDANVSAQKSYGSAIALAHQTPLSRRPSPTL